MKRKISISFVFLLLATVLSLSSVTNNFRNFCLYLSYDGQTLMSIIRHIITCVKSLIPIALVILLVLNSKHDVKKSASITLLIAGIVYLISLLQTLPATFRMITDYYTIIRLPEKILDIVLCIILFTSYSSLKKVKITEKAWKTTWQLTLFGAGFGLVIPVLVAIIDPYSFKLSSFMPALLALGVCFLSNTILDYENCVLLNRKNFKRIAIVAAVLLAIWIIFSGPSDTSGSYRCNNCGGDGWDSANSSSCVWCGGDGKTSWNP